MLPTDVLVALESVNETVEFVAVTLPRVRLPAAPPAVRILVLPLLPASRTPEVMLEKLRAPLLAVMSAFDPNDNGPATLVNVTVVADETSP